jgi:hypothetical protein
VNRLFESEGPLMVAAALIGMTAVPWFAGAGSKLRR